MNLPSLLLNLFSVLALFPRLPRFSHLFSIPLVNAKARLLKKLITLSAYSLVIIPLTLQRIASIFFSLFCHALELLLLFKKMPYAYCPDQIAVIPFHMVPLVLIF